MTTTSENLRAAFEVGAGAWPSVRLEYATFERYVTERHGERADAGGAEVEPMLDALFLCCACVGGDPAACRHFHEAYRDVIRHAVARIESNAAQADEIASALVERLLVGPPPRLTRYDGRGSLAAWLKVSATRAALDARRKRLRIAEEPIDLQVPMPASMSPESVLLCRARGADIVKALERVVAALSPEERNLLRLHYALGQSIDTIGELLGVHRATAARRLERVRSSIDEAVRASLIERGLDEADIPSLVAGMHEYLEVCLRELLVRQSDPGPL